MQDGADEADGAMVVVVVDVVVVELVFVVVVEVAVVVTVGVKTNAAVTLFVPVMVTVQVPLVLVQAPLHPVKLLPVVGVAESSTRVPLLNEALQVLPQVIPAGLLDMVPLPVPELTVVS